MQSFRFENSYASLPDAFYARVHPSKVPAPALVRLNEGLTRELGVDAHWLRSDQGVAMLVGNTLPSSADPIAMAYGGHQFGHWNPRLGDGRAILLGEVVDANGVRRDIQLKGSGRTPFSRNGDGKATLGSMLREYMVSEAMFALGVPTTRALAVVMTGELVQREMSHPGAVLTRVAQSHVRVGTFEHFAARGDVASIQLLADYVIQRHYPAARQNATPYFRALQSIVEKQARLVARWMQLGFIHGVMNTDNMQVAGETIDYGPCAFMDGFDPGRVFSSIDRVGRYAWDRQPEIARWNLLRLAESWLPLLAEEGQEAVTAAESALASFATHFDAEFLGGFRNKLGLLESTPDDSQFVGATLKALAAQQVDFTLFFRNLTKVAQGQDDAVLLGLFADAKLGSHWLASWRQRQRLEADAPEARVATMRWANPIFMARNHRVEEAIQGGLVGDFSRFDRLVRVLEKPYDEQPENADYERAPTAEERVHETFCGT